MKSESSHPTAPGAAPPSDSAQSTEPWLRGTLMEVPAGQRAVLHALELAREDIARWCGTLSEREMHARPYGLGSVAFQLRHIAGSLDRLLTYAEGNHLSAPQLKTLAEEMLPEGSKEALLVTFEAGLGDAERRIRAMDIAKWSELREVGRKKLPTTVAGLLIHCAEHTQRHVGQAITTAKILSALREQPST